MTSIIILLAGLIVCVSSVWAAHDSECYDWSAWNNPRHPEWNPAAESFGTWFLACFLLWPVFFPGYFWDRRYAPLKTTVGLSNFNR
jgi:hypothetical protein